MFILLMQVRIEFMEIYELDEHVAEQDPDVI